MKSFGALQLSSTFNFFATLTCAVKQISAIARSAAVKHSNLTNAQVEASAEQKATYALAALALESLSSD